MSSFLLFAFMINTNQCIIEYLYFSISPCTDLSVHCFAMAYDRIGPVRLMGH